MPKGKKIQVEQIDIETGESIEIYPSIAKAAEDNWIDSSIFNKKIRDGKGEVVFDDRQLLFRRVAN